MKRKLLIHPDPRLKQVAEPIIDEFGSVWLMDLVDDMEKVKGAGLAAIQIGVNKSIIIYKDRAGTVHALCNAKIISCFGSVKSYGESCLSVPEFKADVKRFKGVKVKAQTLSGKTVTIKERGFTAIVLQHEIDHLNGIVIIDRVSGGKK